MHFLTKTTAFSAVLLGLFCFQQFASGQMQIDNFSAATNDRFGNDSAFIADGYDLSGAGRSTRWGTLISENVIITAEHSQATGTIRFYETNDSSGAFVDRNIVASSGQQIGSSDLFLFTLDTPVTSNIAIYDFATEQISGTVGSITNAGSFQGMNTFHFGRSPSALTSTQDIAVGENIITGYLEDVAFSGNTNNDMIILEYNNSGDADYLFHETHVNGGDSGAPLFVDDGTGGLLLLGINTAQLSNNDGSLFGSGITYTGNLSNEINEYISLAAVPEPSSAGLLFGVLCFSAYRRNRTRAHLGS